MSSGSSTEADDAGTIRVLRPLFEIEVGEFDGSRSARAERLAAAFRAAGAQATVSADIIGAMWAKWVFIASIGAVTGLMRAPVRDIVAVAGGARFARAVLDEAAAAAAACGYPVPGRPARVHRALAVRPWLAEHVLPVQGPDRRAADRG